MSRSTLSYLFWFLLGVCIFSFFNRNSARNVNEILPETLKPPVLTEVNGNYSIELISKGFRYTLIPVYECEINGLVVDKMMPGLVMIKGFENALKMNKNFTIIWGSNVTNGVHKNRSIKFWDGGVSWEGGATVNLGELARIGLITKDRNLWSKIKSISGGDQIKVKGKLVNAKADRIIPVTYCTNHFEWKTGFLGQNERFWSVYVEDVQTLKKANVFFNFLFWASLLGLITVIIIRLFGPLKYY